MTPDRRIPSVGQFPLKVGILLKEPCVDLVMARQQNDRPARLKAFPDKITGFIFACERKRHVSCPDIQSEFPGKTYYPYDKPDI